jgi:SAM-dependent methyltransferase
MTTETNLPGADASWLKRGRHRRAMRAIERQLEYQRRKAGALAGREAEVIAAMRVHSGEARSFIESVRPLAEAARVLEVGSGAHGLIFFFGARVRVGVDPLAVEYRALFPAWQTEAQTVAAYGESLPFRDGSFDVVLSDNVVDHAEDPARIVSEMTRVLAPGGLLYFTVNVHHAVYSVAASLHAGWRALGLDFEIAPFADHTTHLTLTRARRLFDGLPLRLLHESHNVEEAVRQARARRPRHAGDRLKRVFFKNAVYKVVAARAGDAAGRAPLSTESQPSAVSQASDRHV